MSKHIPTILADASLDLHVAHRAQRAHQAAIAAAEDQARRELVAEGEPLSVRNLVLRQYEIATRHPVSGEE